MKVLCVDNSQWWAGAEMCLRDYLLLPKQEVEMEVCVPYLMPHHELYEINGTKVFSRSKNLKCWMVENFENPIKGLDRITKIKRSHQLRAILSKNTYDVVYFNLFRERDRWDLEVVKNAGCKVVLHIRSLFHQAPYTKGILDKADLVIGVSNAVCDEVRATGTTTLIKKVYDGVSPESQNIYNKSAMRKKWGLSESDVVVVFPAVFEERKGQDIAIQAWRNIVSDYPEAKLVIAGGAPQGMKGFESDLKELALEISGSVIFTGHIDDIGEMYSLADIVLALSKDGEAFGRVPVEAGLAQLPTIGTRAGATPELMISEQTGLLVEPRNVEQTAEAMNKLLSDETLRKTMGQNAYERSRKHFNLEQGVSDFYNALLSI